MAEHLRSNQTQENQLTNMISVCSIGESWVQRFLHRHPELETTISNTIESTRIKETSKEALNLWFDDLTKIIRENQVTTENMYNMDETGFSIGNIQGAYVVVNKELQKQYQVHPGRQEWVTVLECVCADGQKILPLIILKGKNLSSSWIPKTALVKNNWFFACSALGWTNNELGLKWLKDCFEPATRVKAAGRPRLLICDGHESHVISAFSAFCIKHNILLFLLHPHSSHILQPLDVGVFGPLKKLVSSRLARLIHFGITRLEKVEWVEHYIEARELALSIDNILGGWRGAGLHPLNRNRVIHSLPEISSQPSSLPLTSPENEPNFNNAFTTDSIPNCHILRSLSDLASKNQLNTPARNCIVRLAETTEQLLVENAILKHRLENVEEILGIRQERKQGKRYVLKGVNFISTQSMVEKLRECEEKSKAKKIGSSREKKNTGPNKVQESEDTSEEEEEEIEREILDVIVVEQH
jgi:hypothetical protein